METENLTIEEMWDKLVELGVEEQALTLITAINGYKAETMEDILYAHIGYRSFDQLDDEE